MKLLGFCQWCKVCVYDNEKYNFIFEKCTHKKCDDEYFEKQEKKVKYKDKKIIDVSKV